MHIFWQVLIIFHQVEESPALINDHLIYSEALLQSSAQAPALLGALHGHAGVEQVGHVTYSHWAQSRMGELQSCQEPPVNIGCTDQWSSEVGMQPQKILRKLQVYMQF